MRGNAIVSKSKPMQRNTNLTLRSLLAPSSAPIQPIRVAITPTLRRALVISQGFAVLWWIATLVLRATNTIPVWYDQITKFTQAVPGFADPFTIRNFINAPWLVLFIWPFSLIPLELAILIQVGLTFGILTLVIFKYGGTTGTVVLALSSFIALLATIELNIEWLVFIGLLVPPMWSGIFLLIKPQTALGVWISYSRRNLIRAVIVSVVVVIASFVIWGPDWPLRAWEQIRVISLGQSFNMAPMALVPWPIAIAAGLLLAWLAFKRRDPILSILAWMFFVPYMAPVSLLLPFALFSIRHPKLGILLSVLFWIIYGGVIMLGLLIRAA
jgi:hypothetical protein